jgi:hypothetical protein
MTTESRTRTDYRCSSKTKEVAEEKNSLYLIQTNIHFPLEQKTQQKMMLEVAAALIALRTGYRSSLKMKEVGAEAMNLLDLTQASKNYQLRQKTQRTSEVAVAASDVMKKEAQNSKKIAVEAVAVAEEASGKKRKENRNSKKKLEVGTEEGLNVCSPERETQM